MPSPPEEETDEERGLRRLFEQLAGAVRKQRLHLHRLKPQGSVVVVDGSSRQQRAEASGP